MTANAKPDTRPSRPSPLSIPVFTRTVTLQSAPAIRTFDKTFALMDWSLYTALVRVHFQGAKSDQYHKEIGAVETLIEASVAAVATAFAEEEARWRERRDRANGKHPRPHATLKYQRPREQHVELRTPTMAAFLAIVEAQDRINRLVDETWFARALSGAERIIHTDRLSNRILRLQRRIRMLTRGLFRRVIADHLVPEEGYFKLLKKEGAALPEPVVAMNDAALQADDQPDDEQAFVEALHAAETGVTLVALDPPSATELASAPIAIEASVDPFIAALSAASRP